MTPNSSDDPDQTSLASFSSPSMRLDTISGSVESTDGTIRQPAKFQPWVCGVGATYVAWQIGNETGRLGVYDERSKRLWLGYTGYPDGTGKWYYYVSLGSMNAALKAEVQKGQSMNQSPVTTASPGSLDDWADEDRSLPRRPAPRDAVDVGNKHPYHIEWWNGSAPAVFQPWRPLNGGPILIAYFIGDRSGECGVFYDNAVWYGRSGPLRAWYSARPEPDNVFNSLEQDIIKMYSNVPTEGFCVVDM